MENKENIEMEVLGGYKMIKPNKTLTPQQQEAILKSIEKDGDILSKHVSLDIPPVQKVPDLKKELENITNRIDKVEQNQRKISVFDIISIAIGGLGLIIAGLSLYLQFIQ